MALFVRYPGPDRPNVALYISDLGAIAQMVERLNRTQEASGSNPLSSTHAPTPDLPQDADLTLAERAALAIGPVRMADSAHHSASQTRSR